MSGLCLTPNRSGKNKQMYSSRCRVCCPSLPRLPRPIRVASGTYINKVIHTDTTHTDTIGTVDAVSMYQSALKKQKAAYLRQYRARNRKANVTHAPTPPHKNKLQTEMDTHIDTDAAALARQYKKDYYSRNKLLLAAKKRYYYEENKSRYQSYYLRNRTNYQSYKRSYYHRNKATLNQSRNLANAKQREAIVQQLKESTSVKVSNILLAYWI